MTLPTFIVIGAAKAGTTALYWYLAEHPEVLMSAVKEPNYFAYGLDDGGRPLYGDPELHRFPVRTSAAYEALFAGGRGELAVGEASAIYLECPQTAARIASAIPDARIVCGLRDPVDRAYSDYQMYLRSRGRRLDERREVAAGASWARPDSHWVRIGMYHEMLSRYFDVFPRERIHVYLFDDLLREPAGVLSHLYGFVGVDPSFTPDTDTPHNVGGVPSNMALERVLTSDGLRRVVEPLIPRRVANRVRQLRTKNLRKAPPLPPALREQLAACFHDDIVRTSELIGRNLDAWLAPTRV
ncbi:MAG: sulfotransferase family protein [Actinomycetota bacterium]